MRASRGATPCAPAAWPELRRHARRVAGAKVKGYVAARGGVDMMQVDVRESDDHRDPSRAPTRGQSTGGPIVGGLVPLRQQCARLVTRGGSRSMAPRANGVPSHVGGAEGHATPSERRVAVEG